MTITGISEKEVAIQEDLKSKLDDIASDAPKKRRTKKAVSQEVVSPRDAEVDANVGELDKMKQMIEKNEVPEPVVAPAPVIEYPDATKHKHISFIKSGFRILAGAVLFIGQFEIAGALLIVAEILGIAEEMV